MKGKERAGPEGSLLEGKGLIKQQRAAVAASLHPVSEEQQVLADRHLSPTHAQVRSGKSSGQAYFGFLVTCVAMTSEIRG